LRKSIRKKPGLMPGFFISGFFSRFALSQICPVTNAEPLTRGFKIGGAPMMQCTASHTRKLSHTVT